MDDTQTPAADELSVATCWQLLRQATVGRLAVVVDGRPDIFPISFVANHGSIVFRTAAGTKLTGSAGRPVAFEIDGPGATEPWSVVVKGTAHEVRETAEAIEVLSLPLVPSHGGPKPRLMRIEPSSVTGRRLHAAAGSPA
ncbi:MAG: pyridoxamine 5-phosphate oxidase family protein [Humibacillus sp.]|nr:pyridoxamine 5-phosphate oxidase family protein [Humibacillus sp.]